MFSYFSDNSGIHHVSHCQRSDPMDTVFHRHFHPNYELLLVINGDVHYNIDGQEYILKPYDLLFIPASTYHFVIPMSNARYENYVLNICQDFFEDESLQALFAQPRVLNIYTDRTLHRMFGLFDLYFHTYSENDFRTASNHLLSEILLYARYKLRSIDSTLPTAQTSPLIARITSYIAENLRENLDSDVIATELNFSKSYLQNIFSSTMEIGLQQYINQKKILAAHYDIQSGASLSDVAAKYGFRNYSSFYRQYKKFFGHSPKIGKSE